jgi:hypothetical protein
VNAYTDHTDLAPLHVAGVSMEAAYTCFIVVYLILWAWKILPLMNQSLKLPMLGCHDASSVTDAAFEWLFAHHIVKIFTVFCIIGFGLFSYWHGFNEIMTTNIPGHVITVGDHVVAGVLWGVIGAIIGLFGCLLPFVFVIGLGLMVIMASASLGLMRFADFIRAFMPNK